MNVPTTAAVIEAVATVAAAVLASIALRGSLTTYRASYQPLVRPVPMNRNQPTGMILKNVGRGTALAVTVAKQTDVTETDSDLIAEVDVIEPLGAPRGPTFDEPTRIGRVKIPTNPPHVVIGWSYRIFYQDAAGAWHQTDFTAVRKAGFHAGFETKFRGRCGIWRLRPVPEWIHARRQMAAAEIV